jgi:hypothetical protein
LSANALDGIASFAIHASGLVSPNRSATLTSHPEPGQFWKLPGKP